VCVWVFVAFSFSSADMDHLLSPIFECYAYASADIVGCPMLAVGCCMVVAVVTTATHCLMLV
jgi:hypothetical protein